MTLTDETTGLAADPAPPARTEHGPRLSTVFTWLFAIGGLAIGIRPLHDNSFMWHVRTGRLILDSGIPHHDPYSFTANGTKWVAQSWLAELLYGVINTSSAHAFGLRLLGAATGLVVGAMLFRLAWKCANDRVRAGALTVLALAALLNVWSERPLMLGIVAMLLLVYLIEVPGNWMARYPYVTIPVLMWLWANVHGTYVIGFGYLALHLVGRAMEGQPPTRGPERTMLRASVLAGLLTFLNPYGLDLVLFPLRLMGRGEVLKDVSEWQSPNFREGGGMLFGAFLIVTLVLMARKRPGLRDLLITVVFMILGLWAVRNVGLAVVAILPIQARLVHNPNPRPDERKPVHRLMVAVAVLALCVAVLRAAGQDDWNLKAYPVDAFKAVQAQHLEGRRLFTTDAWAGYVIATAWPHQQVFFDDRYDMYPVVVDRDYGTIAGVAPKWRETLDKYKVDLVMEPHAGALNQALAENPDWVKVHEDKVATVWARKSSLPS